jgi:hypothetical protein
LVAVDKPIDDWSNIDEVGVLIKTFVAFFDRPVLGKHASNVRIRQISRIGLNI